MMIKTETKMIDIQLIKNWNIKRSSKEGVISIFKNNGNTFSFTLSEAINDDLHIYFGLDGNNNASMTILKASDDIENVSQCIDIVPFSESNGELPNPGTANPNEDTISWDTATECVGNWKDVDIRLAWIEGKFLNNATENIFSVFVVPQIDISVGVEHKFYLSLKLDEENRYQADLIILNLETNNIISKNLEDMVYSVPPFGDIKSKFGLLES